MKTIAIDVGLCTGCSLCGQACPRKLYTFPDKKAVLAYPEKCFSCGHCAAVCPENAISSYKNNTVHPFTVKALSEEELSVDRFLEGKRSIRHFNDKPVSKEIISEVLSMAEKAPSAVNVRKRKYWVVSGEEKVAALEQAVGSKITRLLRLVNPVVVAVLRLIAPKTGRYLRSMRPHMAGLRNSILAGKNPIFRKAPVVVLVAAPKQGQTHRDDAAAALQYLMLAAESRGLGSCMIGYGKIAWKEIGQQLNLPKDYRIYDVCTLGYPKLNYLRGIDYGPADVVFVGMDSTSS